MTKWILAALITLFDASAFAQQPPPELTVPDLEAFLDGLVPAQIERADIAGAVVAVVKDGKSLLDEGVRLLGLREEDPRLPADDALSPRVHLQAFHLDRGDAAGGDGEARSGPGRQLGGVGALVAVWNSLKPWGDRGQWFWSKVWYTLVALACVGLFWFIVYWRMLNFDLRY